MHVQMQVLAKAVPLVGGVLASLFIPAELLPAFTQGLKEGLVGQSKHSRAVGSSVSVRRAPSGRPRRTRRSSPRMCRSQKLCHRLTWGCTASRAVDGGVAGEGGGARGRAGGCQGQHSSFATPKKLRLRCTSRRGWRSGGRRRRSARRRWRT